MNTLTLIKTQIEKAARLHDAQIAMTSYRGVKYECKQGAEEIHGTFCYRGRTYNKWNIFYIDEGRGSWQTLFFCVELPLSALKTMDKEKLKLIVRNLESLVECLKSEIYSDVDAYKQNFQDPLITDYDEVFYDDDDGYPD